MKREIRRQFVHYLFGSIFISLIMLQGIHWIRILLFTCFFVGIIISELIKKGWNIPFFSEVNCTVERDYEKEMPGKGALVFFLSAILLMFIITRQEIVLGALIVGVYGDAASTIFGIKFGKHKIIGEKTIEGTISGIVISAILLSLIFPLHVAIIAATIGMLAELIPVDDNFTIPFTVAAILMLLI